MNWWHYLLLVNLYLVLFYSFYALLLRRETYFQLNRVYLVSAAILSFFIPVIQADWVKNLFITQQVRYSIYGGGSNLVIYAFKPIENNALTIGQVFTWLYLAGIVFLTIRFLLQLIRLNKMIRQPEPSAAYSFFKKISLGKNMVKEDAIMAHEQVHARQWHSVDVLIIEAVMIINWFNPVVYLYRFAIKHIHEFIADQQALKIGADKAEYALLLLSRTFNAPSHQLVNPFYNHSLLKQRIIMIQKNKSQRIVLIKYVLSAPLFGLMLILSSATVNNSKAITTINTKADNIFQEPAVATIAGIDNNGEIPAGQLTPETSAAPVNNNDEKVTPADTVKEKVYESVEVEPNFPGGINEFYAYLSKTIRYPAEDRKNKVSGKVFVQFIVEKDGSLSNIKAVRGPSSAMQEESVRAISISPKWEPGIQNGKKVRVEYTLPVNFSLDGDKVIKTKITNLVLTPPRTANSGDKVYESVETEPEFPGGMRAFYEFLAKTIRYPADARKDKIQGKVFVQFIIEKDGSVSDVKAVRGPGHGLGEEAARAITLSPKWHPGIQNGKEVRVEYTVPVNFTLDEDKTVKRKVTNVVLTPPVHITSYSGDKVYESVETEPVFPGGIPAFYEFLGKTVSYPADARRDNITGKVFVRFVIEPDGSLSNVKAFRGPGHGMNEEAERAIKLSPNWHPGTQNGKPVRVEYTVPVNFTLNANN